jgi:hypothetical protein
MSHGFFLTRERRAELPGLCVRAWARVGHWLSGRMQAQYWSAAGVAVPGPSSGIRRCLNPRLSLFPTSSSIIPDGGISPIRLEAKRFLHGACPLRVQFKRWCAFAVHTSVCSMPRLGGWQLILRTLSSGQTFRSKPPSPRAPLLQRYTLLPCYYEPMRRSRCLSSSFRAPHL